MKAIGQIHLHQLDHVIFNMANGGTVYVAHSIDFILTWSTWGGLHGMPWCGVIWADGGGRSLTRGVSGSGVSRTYTPTGWNGLSIHCYKSNVLHCEDENFHIPYHNTIFFKTDSEARMTIINSFFIFYYN